MWDPVELALSITLLIIALVASILIPSKKKILQGITYKGWIKFFIYGIGVTLIITSVFFLILLFLEGIKDLKLHTLLNIIFFNLVGVLLIEENYRGYRAIGKAIVSQQAAIPATAPLSLKIVCGNCSKEITALQSMRGKIINCPHCGIKGRIG